MAGIRLERFIWHTTKGLRVDNSERTGEPLFGDSKPEKQAAAPAGRKLKPSRELAAITGNAPLPRSQVISKVWDHIRKNNLQNPQNKREIMADAKLKPIFGGKDRVSMFEMNKRLSHHLDADSQKSPSKDSHGSAGASPKRKRA